MWNKNESNQFTHVYKGIKMFKNYSSFENYLETYVMAWKTNILCEKTASCKSDDIWSQLHENKLCVYANMSRKYLKIHKTVQQCLPTEEWSYNSAWFNY